MNDTRYEQHIFLFFKISFSSFFTYFYCMLEVLNLVKLYKDVAAVNGISFKVEPGRIFGLLGPNGAGKTTTLRTILNIIKPEKGDVLFNGKPIDESFFNRMGYLPEERGLYKKSKVLDVIVYFAQLKNLSRHDALKEAEKWLERLHVSDLKNKKIEALSKGNQQKIQFITAILHNPELLVLDEPFSGFDPINQQEIKDIINTLINEGTIIILSTHMMETAERLCADIFLMNKGTEVLSGSLTSIKKRFSGNSIKLIYEGDDECLYHLPQVKRVDKFNQYAEVELNEGISPMEFLISISTLLEISHFSISHPSLDQIFIDSIREMNRR